MRKAYFADGIYDKRDSFGPEKIQKITELGVDAINFSIDGPEEVHDRLRGRVISQK